MIAVPQLETKRLNLIPLSINDVDSYQRHFVDYEVIRHLSDLVPWPYPQNGVRDFLEKILLPKQGDGRWTWGLRLKTSPDDVIGCVDLWTPGTPENRGFWLGKNYWGQGLMTEVVTPIMEFAFKTAGFEKLVFANAVGNERSRRVKEKTGARLVEVKSAKFVDPLYNEHEIWELTKAAWIERAATPIIRHLKETDVAAFAEIIAQVKIQEFRAESDIKSLATRERDRLLKLIAEKKARFFILEQDARVMGGGGFIPFSTDGVCELTSLFFLSETRGRGLGQKLMSRLLNEAKNAGYNRCYLETLKTMAAAQKLYTKCGFQKLNQPLSINTPEYLECWMIRDV
jgi:ribosomal-protein-alanine N-acetyltransferase